MAAPFTLHAVTVGSTTISGIQSVSVAPGVAEQVEFDGNRISPIHVSVAGASPVIQFTTNQVEAVLKMHSAALASNGYLKITVASTATVLTFQNRVQGGTFDTTKSVTATVNEGLLIIDNISVSQAGRATASLTLIPVWDGSATNGPLVMAKNVTANVAGQALDVHTLGPWDVNGSRITGLSSFGFNFGIVPDIVTTDGDIWATNASIKAHAPSMTCTTLDLARLDQAAEFGAFGTEWSSDTEAYLRSVSQGGLLGADVDTTHIKFSMLGGRIRISNAGASGMENAAATITCTMAQASPGTAVMTVSTDTAIT